ncbi:VIT1/CCC1 transporter family protein [Sporichthya polymorpha]|uniref:VIT1/CCC1 transporter family protein n=1 Tax=Sporichthya polymorpha TaxID=35751 RepID=UPI000377AF52|nr:VIT family protein [Sporichthya polymorpha]
MSEDSATEHPGEAHPPHGATSDRLNRLRAAVLGANDGIVSQAGLVVGVAGATTDRTTLLTAGLAGLVAGAVSMSLGEYVSVSSQRDAEQELLAQEKRELAEQPEAELAELAEIYEQKGLRPETARTVARELTEADALGAHAEAELHIDPDDLINPYTAGLASAVAFVLGALLPLLAITLPPVTARVPTTVAVTLAALALLGWLSARAGNTDPRRPVLRVLIGGSAALAITYAIGNVTGAAIS